jgi:hypothetical protein
LTVGWNGDRWRVVEKEVVDGQSAVDVPQSIPIVVEDGPQEAVVVKINTHGRVEEYLLPGQHADALHL